jgi:hypothetical protein
MKYKLYDRVLVTKGSRKGLKGIIYSVDKRDLHYHNQIIYGIIFDEKCEHDPIRKGDYGRDREGIYFIPQFGDKFAGRKWGWIENECLQPLVRYYPNTKLFLNIHTKHKLLENKNLIKVELE